MAIEANKSGVSFSNGVFVSTRQDTVPLAVIDGTQGDDVLNGTDGDDRINGYGGRDSLFGHDGDDVLNGGGGSDVLDGGDGNDWLNTAVGDGLWQDSLSGGSGNDVLTSGYGNDLLHGGDGDDILISGGGPISGSVSGNTDGDTVYGDAGDDTLIGSGLSDRLYGGVGNDVLFGGNEQDILYGDAGADFMDGGDGWDYADYRTADTGVTIDLQTGLGRGGVAEGDIFRNIEYVRGSDFADTLIGDAGNNLLLGFVGNDNLSGGGGNDQLDGGAGDDVLRGDAGDDRFTGGAGADHFDGGDGSDTMLLRSYSGVFSPLTVNLEAGTASGGAFDPGDTFTSIENVVATQFNDILTGDAKDNAFTGDDGADHIDGGDGSDTVIYYGEVFGGGGSFGIGVTVDLANSTAYGADANGDTIISIENVVGSTYEDSLTGSDAANRISGGGGIDNVFGAGGDDVLIDPDGGDSLYGGAGADVFVFNYGESGLIKDFNSLDGDKIDLTDFYGPYGLNNQDPQDLTFTGYREFTGKSGQLNLVQTSDSTLVQIDVDGDQTADFQITLEGISNVLTSDAFEL